MLGLPAWTLTADLLTSVAEVSVEEGKLAELAST
jgi:hypothetical protein